MNPAQALLVVAVASAVGGAVDGAAHAAAGGAFSERARGKQPASPRSGDADVGEKCTKDGKRKNDDGGGGGSRAKGNRKPKRTYAAVADDKMAAGYVFEDKRMHKDIAANHKKNGFVIFRVLSDAKCDELILWIWANVIYKQPWKDGVCVRLTGRDGRVLDPSKDADKAKVLAQVKGPLTTELRKRFEKGWTLHRGFGASCDPQVFHHELLWECRTDKDAYEIACLILETYKLLVTIERHIEKLPGQGLAEFWHFDWNLWNRLLAIWAKEKEEVSVAGKMMYTDSSLKFKKGTHTNKWLLEFYRVYQQIYETQFKSKGPKFSLNPQYEDPLNLMDDTDSVYFIPAGCMVLFDPRGLHGVSRTDINGPTEYGHYQGYMRAERTPERIAQYLKKADIDEIDDRVRSYEEGRAPELWPSLDTVHFYCAMFDTRPPLMQVYLDKLPPVHAMRGTRRGAGDNSHKTYDILNTPGNPGYVKPALDVFGERLLGKTAWPESEAEGAAVVVLDDTESDSGAEGAAVVVLDDTESESEEDVFAPAKRVRA